MSYSTARNSITDGFATGWGSTTRIAYDNIEPDPPMPVGTSFVRLSIQMNLSDQITIGSTNQTYRRFGICFVQIFTPEGSGYAGATTLVDTAVALFEGKKMGTVVFQDVNVREVGNPRSEPFYQVNIAAAFRFDDIV